MIATVLSATQRWPASIGLCSGCQSSVRQARRLPYNFSAIKLCCELFNPLLPFAVVHLHSLDALFAGRGGTVVSRVAFDPLHFGVHPAGLLHLPHTWVRSQVSLGAPLQLAVKSLVVGVQLGEQTFRQDRSGQALSDHERIVPQHGEEFAQHSGLFGVTGDALHLSLELVRCDWSLPVILQRL